MNRDAFFVASNIRAMMWNRTHFLCQSKQTHQNNTQQFDQRKPPAGSKSRSYYMNAWGARSGRRPTCFEASEKRQTCGGRGRRAAIFVAWGLVASRQITAPSRHPQAFNLHCGRECDVMLGDTGLEWWWCVCGGGRGGRDLIAFLQDFWKVTIVTVSLLQRVLGWWRFRKARRLIF